ncbi:hypothetical protein ACQ4WP_14285 [Janthinobacterium sp. GB4P2]|uniref:hypothetical protein n=1 Tax=Janthinobacterium sp. GB4P2 TaxID=3424189 RepID=UPI003F2618AF
MSEELQFTDSRALSAPFAQQLSHQPPDGALAWLAACLAAHGAPRIQATVTSITKHADDILRGGPRGVAVTDLPRLYLDPAPFQNAPAILAQHETVVGGMRENMQNLLKGIV